MTSAASVLQCAQRPSEGPWAASQAGQEQPQPLPSRVMCLPATPYIPLSNFSRTVLSSAAAVSSWWCLFIAAQVIPGNETKVAEMLNSLAMQGARVVAGRTDNLHVSGHAYQVRGLLRG